MQTCAGPQMTKPAPATHLHPVAGRAVWQTPNSNCNLLDVGSLRLHHLWPLCSESRQVFHPCSRTSCKRRALLGTVAGHDEGLRGLRCVHERKDTSATVMAWWFGCCYLRLSLCVPFAQHLISNKCRVLRSLQFSAPYVHLLRFCVPKDIFGLEKCFAPRHTKLLEPMCVSSAREKGE